MRKGVKFKPTPEQKQLAKTLSGYGIPQKDIARELGVDEKTLKVHLQPELDEGMTKANAKVVESLFKLATIKQNPAAAIFWCKCRLGWREVVEHSGAGGAELFPSLKIIIEKE